MPIYTGKTIEETKQAAGAALGVPVDQLTIKVLQEPRRGFLGIGRRPAQISAEPIAAHKPKAAKEVKTPASSAPVKSAAAQAPAKPAVITYWGGNWMEISSVARRAQDFPIPI